MEGGFCSSTYTTGHYLTPNCDWRTNDINYALKSPLNSKHILVVFLFWQIFAVYIVLNSSVYKYFCDKCTEQ